MHLHADLDSRLEAGKIGWVDSSRGGDNDLRHNFAGNTGVQDTVASHLGLEGTNGGHLVSSTDSIDGADLFSRVDSFGGNTKISVDFVQQTKRESVLGSGSDRGRHGSRSIGETIVESRDSLIFAQSKSGISSNNQSRRKSVTGRSGKLGKSSNIQNSSSSKSSLFVINAQVGSLSGLETKFEFRGNGKRSFQNLGSIGLELTLVHTEFGIREFGANL